MALILAFFCSPFGNIYKLVFDLRNINTRVMNHFIFKVNVSFLSIRFIVIDEAHAYKGAFGCHTSLIIRRLCRICSHGRFFRSKSLG